MQTFFPSPVRQSKGHVIAIDIGGTNFRSVILDSEHKFVAAPETIPTPNFLNHPQLSIDKLQTLLVDLIIKTVIKYQSKDGLVMPVGIAFPAAIGPGGVAHITPGIWGDLGKSFPLLKVLSERLPLTKFYVINDLTAAVERYAGDVEDINYFQVITVSTGIGAKIFDVRNRMVLTNKQGYGGDIGHIKLDFAENAPRCGCGQLGHLEALSSGRAIEQLVITRSKEFPEKFKDSWLNKNCKKITNEHIVNAIKAGDQFCSEILDHTTFYLAIVIAQTATNVGVDKFIIIGGFALSLGNLYLESLKNNLLKVDFFNHSREEVLGMVELGNKDGYDCLIGAGMIVQKLQTEKLMSVKGKNQESKSHATTPIKSCL